jgi:hypothetical protein
VRRRETTGGEIWVRRCRDKGDGGLAQSDRVKLGWVFIASI